MAVASTKGRSTILLLMAVSVISLVFLTWSPDKERPASGLRARSGIQEAELGFSGTEDVRVAVFCLERSGSTWYVCVYVLIRSDLK